MLRTIIPALVDISKNQTDDEDDDGDDGDDDNDDDDDKKRCSCTFDGFRYKRSG